jgi:hypothetical protein
MQKLVAFIFMLLVSTASAGSITAPENWNKVGEAELKVLWFHIYSAALFTPSGKYLNVDVNKPNPLLLELTYKRNISKADLIEETEEQLEMFTESEKIPIWIGQLNQIWPEISKGDQLSFWIDEQGHGNFFYNQSWIGVVTEPEFSNAFINIWLSEKSSYPELAKELRGESTDEELR